MNHIVRIGVLAVSLAALGACKKDTGAPVAPATTSDLVVSGEVTAIQNDIAVDGGITLDVDVVDNGTDRLIFGGLFTVPPPTDEQLALYDVVRRVEVGDVVRAQGVRRDYGIILDKLWILEGRP